jgi:hypothetical protein
VKETTMDYLGDPMRMIIGPGSRNQMTHVTCIYCTSCGLKYEFLPPNDTSGLFDLGLSQSVLDHLSEGDKQWATLSALEQQARLGVSARQFFDEEQVKNMFTTPEMYKASEELRRKISEAPCPTCGTTPRCTVCIGTGDKC